MRASGASLSRLPDDALQALLSTVEPPQPRAPLTDEARAILARFDPIETPLRVLNWGVGAGKTETELRAITDKLAADIAADRRRQYLLVLPTVQMVRDLYVRLGDIAAAAGLDLPATDIEMLIGWQSLRPAETADNPLPGTSCAFRSAMVANIRAGVAPSRLCRGERLDASGEKIPYECPMLATCHLGRVHLRRATPDDAPRVLIAHHNFLKLTPPATLRFFPDEVLIDEECDGALILDVHISLAQWLGLFPAVVDAEPMMTRGMRPVPHDEDEPDPAYAAHRETHARVAEALRAAAYDGPEHAVSTAPLREIIPEIAGLLGYLERKRDGGTWARAPLYTPDNAGVAPEVAEAVPSALERAIVLLHAILAGLRGDGVIIPGLRAWRRRADGTYYPRHELLAEGAKLMDHQIEIKGEARAALSESVRGAEEFALLSATGHAEVLSPWWPNIDVDRRAPVVPPNDIYRVQIRGGGSVSAVIDWHDKLTDPLGVTIAEDIAFLAGLRRGRVLVVTTKRIIDALQAHLGEVEGVVYMTAAACTGRDDLKDCFAFLSIARTLPTPTELLPRLEAVLGRRVEPPPEREGEKIRYWEEGEPVTQYTRGGHAFTVRGGPVYRDPATGEIDAVATALLRQTAISGVDQSDRSRAVRRDGPAIRIVYADLPLQETFDRAATQVRSALLEPERLALSEQIGLDPQRRKKGDQKVLGVLCGYPPEVLWREIFPRMAGGLDDVVSGVAQFIENPVPVTLTLRPPAGLAVTGHLLVGGKATLTGEARAQDAVAWLEEQLAEMQARGSLPGGWTWLAVAT